MAATPVEAATATTTTTTTTATTMTATTTTEAPATTATTTTTTPSTKTAVVMTNNALPVWHIQLPESSCDWLTVTVGMYEISINKRL